MAGEEMGVTFAPLLVGAGEAGLDISGPLLLVVLALAVALAVRAVRVPYTIALVFTGLVIGLSSRAEQLLHIPADALVPDLIFLILLPPLLFEGCVNIDLETFRRRGLFVVALAVLGTLITVAAVGFPVAAMFGGPLGLEPQRALLVGLLIGTIVAPTDPVSVLALFKELGVKKDLAVLVEGESVLNDGVGVVVYLILLSLLGGHSTGVTGGLAMFLFEVGGGSLIGLVLGYLTYRLMERIDDRLIEVILSLVVAYGAYVVADRVHASGVLSVVVAGLVIGNYGKTLGMSPTTRLTLTSFWEVLAFLANSVLFLVVGIKLDAPLIAAHLGAILAVFAIGLAGRAVAVAVCAGLARLREPPVPRNWLAVSWWGGVRGSIPIAMALGLLGGAHGLEPAQVREVVVLVYGVVLVSLAAQGLTIGPLLRRLGLARKGEVERRFERALGRLMALEAGRRELSEMHRQHELNELTRQELGDRIAAQQERARAELTELLTAHPDLRRTQEERAVWRVLHAQRAALDDALQRGILSEEEHRRLATDIDARLHTGLAITFGDEPAAPDFES